MIIEISSDALLDLEEGFAFYQQQSEGLGAYFISCLTSDIEALAYFWGIHEVVNAYYRALSKRFPFCIYYDIKDDTLIVVAVLDTRRNPLLIRQRLGWLVVTDLVATDGIKKNRRPFKLGSLTHLPPCDYNVITRWDITMRARLVKIGNSRGLRLAKPLLEQAGLSDEVEILAAPGLLTIRPVARPRAGWAEAAAAQPPQGLLDAPSATRFDDDEWRWWATCL